MIRILLFAYLQDAVGKREVDVPYETMRVDEIKQWFIETYHVASLQHVMVAVNEEYATDDTIVTGQDTVAFIPPVSGG